MPGSMSQSNCGGTSMLDDMPQSDEVYKGVGHEESATAEAVKGT